MAYKKKRVNKGGEDDLVLFLFLVKGVGKGNQEDGKGTSLKTRLAHTG